jgi:hypothetical protein
MAPLLFQKSVIIRTGTIAPERENLQAFPSMQDEPQQNDDRNRNANCPKKDAAAHDGFLSFMIVFAK